MKIRFTQTPKYGDAEYQNHITLNLQQQHITNLKVEQAKRNLQDSGMNRHESPGEVSVHVLVLTTRLGSMRRNVLMKMLCHNYF